MNITDFLVKKCVNAGLEAIKPHEAEVIDRVSQRIPRHVLKFKKDGDMFIFKGIEPYHKRHV